LRIDANRPVIRNIDENPDVRAKSEWLTQSRGHGLVRDSTSLYCLRFALCLLLVGAGGCLVLPIPQSTPAGARVTAEDTSPLKAGVTTKAEIIQKLGTPQLELPDLRLIAYEWNQVDYQLLWILVGGYSAAGGAEEIKLPHAFFAAFDQGDRVLVFDFEKLSLWRNRPIQEAAREWAKRQGLAVPDLPPRFVPLDTPSGQAALYIYQPAGPPVPWPAVWVDGKLEAELKKGTYVALTLPPGNHTVRVDTGPKGSLTDPSKTVSLDLAPNMKYFISFKMWYSWWSGELLLETNPHSEQEAMPVLSRMAPAR